LPGKDVFSGISYQAHAAFALFLQYLKDPEFNHIHLEAPDWADFNLVFNDGHKIICEAKSIGRGVQDHTVRNILKKIEKAKHIDEKDEILIVCNKYSARVFEIAKYYKYMPESYDRLLDEKGYTEEGKKLIPKLKVWKVEKDTLKSIIYLLFFELIGFWLPDGDINRVIRSILIEDIYEGSEKGSTFSRNEIYENIRLLAEEIRDSSTSFNDNLKSKEEQIKTIIRDVRSNRPRKGRRDIAALSQKPDLMFLLLDELKRRKRLDLAQWDTLWRACLTHIYPYALFDVFEMHMKSKNNRVYILEFLENNFARFSNFYSEGYFETKIAKILNVIVEKDPEKHKIVLKIIQEQIEKYGLDIFYLKQDNSAVYKLAELSKTITLLFLKAKDDMRNEIYKFIVNTFNLVGDEGDSIQYTPRNIFQIIKSYLNDKRNLLFEHRFLDLCQHLSEQYNRFYKQFGKELEFDGWELIGSSISLFAGKYTVSDRQFITKVLIPSLGELEEEYRWDFVCKHCVTSARKVSKERPDFLNRAAIPFVMQKYKEGNERALGILKEFLHSRKGIPNKSELIYQELVGLDCSDEGKWLLVDISLRRYGIPVNPFVEIIVGNLARSGHKEALGQLRTWAKDTRYYQTPIFGERQLISNINKLLDNHQKEAIAIFKEFVTGEYFKNTLESFYIIDVSSLFSEIILTNTEKGWRMWDGQNRAKKLTSNQQRLLVGTLGKLAEKKDTEYRDSIIRRVTSMTEEYKVFVRKFNDGYARQQVLDIVEELVKGGLDPSSGLSIIKRFTADPDPSIENEPDDSQGEFNYHKKIENGQFPNIITSVRGKIPWVLQHVIKPGIEQEIDTVIQMVNSLTNDNNLYVRLQACVALARLVQSSNWKIGNRRFIKKEIARRIEDIAFDMLKDVRNEAPAIQQGLAQVFNYMRSIGFKRAYKASRYFAQAHDEARNDYIATIIYFSEFHPSFKEKTKRRFRDILYSLIDSSDSAKRKIAWHMWTMAKMEVKGGDDHLGIALKYLWKLAEKYDRETFKSLYMLMKENIGNKTYRRKLASLYSICIKNESEYLTAHEDYESRAWAAFHDNGDILNAIYKFNKELYIENLKILIAYPKECHIGNIRDTIDNLYNMPNQYDEDISGIFESLMQRSAVYYEPKEKWERILREKEQNEKKAG
jgi:hypothetical protein